MGASLASKLGTPDENEELGFCSAVVLSVQTEQSVRTVIDESIRMFSNKVSYVWRNSDGDRRGFNDIAMIIM